jgi:hypothetical protein
VPRTVSAIGQEGAPQVGQAGGHLLLLAMPLLGQELAEGGPGTPLGGAVCIRWRRERQDVLRPAVIGPSKVRRRRLVRQDRHIPQQAQRLRDEIEGGAEVVRTRTRPRRGVDGLRVDSIGLGLRYRLGASSEQPPRAPFTHRATSASGHCARQASASHRSRSVNLFGSSHATPGENLAHCRERTARLF